jgi:hypothetical protein
VSDDKVFKPGVGNGTDLKPLTEYDNRLEEMFTADLRLTGRKDVEVEKFPPVKVDYSIHPSITKKIPNHQPVDYKLDVTAYPNFQTEYHLGIVDQNDFSIADYTADESDANNLEAEDYMSDRELNFYQTMENMRYPASGETTDAVTPFRNYNRRFYNWEGLYNDGYDLLEDETHGHDKDHPKETLDLEDIDFLEMPEYTDFIYTAFPRLWFQWEVTSSITSDDTYEPDSADGKTWTDGFDPVACNARRDRSIGYSTISKLDRPIDNTYTDSISYGNLNDFEYDGKGYRKLVDNMHEKMKTHLWKPQLRITGWSESTTDDDWSWPSRFGLDPGEVGIDDSGDMMFSIDVAKAFPKIETFKGENTKVRFPWPNTTSDNGGRIGYNKHYNNDGDVDKITVRTLHKNSQIDAFEDSDFDFDAGFGAGVIAGSMTVVIGACLSVPGIGWLAAAAFGIAMAIYGHTPVPLVGLEFEISVETGQLHVTSVKSTFGKDVVGTSISDRHFEFTDSSPPTTNSNVEVKFAKDLDNKQSNYNSTTDKYDLYAITDYSKQDELPTDNKLSKVDTELKGEGTGLSSWTESSPTNMVNIPSLSEFGLPESVVFYPDIYDGKKAYDPNYDPYPLTVMLADVTKYVDKDGVGNKDHVAKILESDAYLDSDTDTFQELTDKLQHFVICGIPDAEANATYTYGVDDTIGDDSRCIFETEYEFNGNYPDFLQAQTIYKCNTIDIINIDNAKILYSATTDDPQQKKFRTKYHKINNSIDATLDHNCKFSLRPNRIKLYNETPFNQDTTMVNQYGKPVVMNWHITPNELYEFNNVEVADNQITLKDNVRLNSLEIRNSSDDTIEYDYTIIDNAENIVELNTSVADGTLVDVFGYVTKESTSDSYSVEIKKTTQYFDNTIDLYCSDTAIVEEIDISGETTYPKIQYRELHDIEGFEQYTANTPNEPAVLFTVQPKVKDNPDSEINMINKENNVLISDNKRVYEDDTETLHPDLDYHFDIDICWITTEHTLNNGYLDNSFERNAPIFLQTKSRNFIVEQVDLTPIGFTCVTNKDKQRIGQEDFRAKVNFDELVITTQDRRDSTYIDQNLSVIGMDKFNDVDNQSGQFSYSPWAQPNTFEYEVVVDSVEFLGDYTIDDFEESSSGTETDILAQNTTAELKYYQMNDGNPNKARSLQGQISQVLNNELTISCDYNTFTINTETVASSIVVSYPNDNKGYSSYPTKEISEGIGKVCMAYSDLPWRGELPDPSFFAFDDDVYPPYEYFVDSSNRNINFKVDRSNNKLLGLRQESIVWKPFIHTGYFYLHNEADDGTDLIEENYLYKTKEEEWLTPGVDDVNDEGVVTKVANIEPQQFAPVIVKARNSGDTGIDEMTEFKRVIFFDENDRMTITKEETLKVGENGLVYLTYNNLRSDSLEILDSNGNSLNIGTIEDNKVEIISDDDLAGEEVEVSYIVENAFMMRKVYNSDESRFETEFKFSNQFSQYVIYYESNSHSPYYELEDVDINPTVNDMQESFIFVTNDDTDAKEIDFFVPNKSISTKEEEFVMKVKILDSYGNPVYNAFNDKDVTIQSVDGYADIEIINARDEDEYPKYNKTLLGNSRPDSIPDCFGNVYFKYVLKDDYKDITEDTIEVTIDGVTDTVDLEFYKPITKEQFAFIELDKNQNIMTDVETKEITIKVYDGNYNPISNANVDIYIGETLAKSGVSDGNGQISFFYQYDGSLSSEQDIVFISTDIKNFDGHKYNDVQKLIIMQAPTSGVVDTIKDIARSITSGLNPPSDYEPEKSEDFETRTKDNTDSTMVTDTITFGITNTLLGAASTIESSSPSSDEELESSVKDSAESLIGGGFF